MNKNEILKQDANTILDRIAIYPNTPQRVSTKLAKYILLEYPTMMLSGKMYSTQVRNVGAGVKEIYLKKI